MSTKIAKGIQRKKVLLVDNYDSFTYILLRTLEELDMLCITVKKNDTIDIAEIKDYDAVILSPGPGYPSTSGICCELIRQFAPTMPILGICLGHQTIAEVFGATLINLPMVHHGEITDLKITKPHFLFKGLIEPIEVGLYHSWAVSKEDCPDCLEIIAVSGNGIIMSLQHKNFPIVGVQFHPESIMTSQGHLILQNWVNSLYCSAN